MTIYTLGYTGWKIEQIEAELERLDATLVDVRMVPRSRAPIWNSGVLARRLGERYVWLKEFGNRNYKGTFDQIEIADFPAGEQRLRDIIAGTGHGLSEPGRAEPKGRSIILMCGCPEVSLCHRKLLAEWLAQAWQTEVLHLTPPSRQPVLF